MTTRRRHRRGGRTPFARSGTVLKNMTAIDLGTLAVRDLMDRSGIPGEEVDHLVYGTVVHDPHAPNIAREVGLATLPQTVPAVTVSRACASANQAIADGVSLIERGYAEVVVAGGSGVAIAYSHHDQTVVRGEADRRLQGEDPQGPPGRGRQNPTEGPHPELPADRGAHDGREHGGVGREDGQGERHQPG